MRKEIYLTCMLFCLFSAYGFTQCQFSNITTQDPLCFGSVDGNLSLEVVNATQPITYIWTITTGLIDSLNGQGSSFSLNGLSGGTYMLTARDAANCLIQTNISLVEPLEVVATFNVTDVSCGGSQDGTITVVAAGGIPPYLYSLDGSGQVPSPIFSGLSAGVHQVTVIDANGCAATGSVVINEQPGVVINITTSDVACFGGSDGAAFATAFGGAGGYDFSWSNGFNGPTATGLNAGIYSLTVTDANGCTAEVTTVVNEPAPY